MTGDRLKYEIKRRGYTVRRLAEHTGTTPQNISRKLNLDDVPTSLLEAAADMMNVTPAELYGCGDTITATHNSTAFKGQQHNAADPRILDILQQQQQAIAALQQQQAAILTLLHTHINNN